MGFIVIGWCDSATELAWDIRSGKPSSLLALKIKASRMETWLFSHYNMLADVGVQHWKHWQVTHGVSVSVVVCVFVVAAFLLLLAWERYFKKSVSATSSQTIMIIIGTSVWK